MTEATVVNLFLTVRVFLLGAIFLIVPRITRKGLVFGTYVGEAVAEGGAVRGLLRSWTRGCVLAMVLALLVGLSISFAGWPVTGNLTGTALMLLSAPVLYIQMFRKARTLAPPAVARQAEVASASLAVSSSTVLRFAKLALAICLLTGLGTILYAAASYENLPARLPTYSNVFGHGDALTEKSIVAVLYAPCLSLALSMAFALISVLMAGAKRSVRAGSGSHSAAAQEAYNAIQVQTFSGTALFICLILTMLSVQYIRIAQSQTRSLGLALLWACAAMIVFSLVSLVRIMKGSGQGGSLLEEGSVEAPLTGGLADNAHWLWGVIYFNKDDPSMLMESRFGIGYALNFGNWKAVLLSFTVLLLILSLLALPLTGIVE